MAYYKQADVALVETDSVGKVIPPSTGGCSIKRIVSAGTSDDLTSVKATAGQVYGIYATNVNAAIRYIKFYNILNTSVTVGTSAIALTVGLPAASAQNISFFGGIEFDTAISFALVTGVADNDATDVASG